MGINLRGWLAADLKQSASLSLSLLRIHYEMVHSFTLYCLLPLFPFQQIPLLMKVESSFSARANNIIFLKALLCLQNLLQTHSICNCLHVQKRLQKLTFYLSALKEVSKFLLTKKKKKSLIAPQKTSSLICLKLEIFSETSWIQWAPVHFYDSWWRTKGNRPVNSLDAKEENIHPQFRRLKKKKKALCLTFVNYKLQRFVPPLKGALLSWICYIQLNTFLKK